MVTKRNFRSLLADTVKFEEKGQVVEGVIMNLETKMICGEQVPSMCFVDPNGEVKSLLCSPYALIQFWMNDKVQPDGYFAIRYDGESKSIKKANNYAKLFSCVYWAPGAYDIDEDGEIVGEPTELNPAVDSRREFLDAFGEPVKQAYGTVPQVEGVFDPESPESGPTKRKRRK